MFQDFISSDKVFLIAEVGQNHQGDLDLAKEYIKVFAHQGADAIKFQTRNNKFLFSLDAFNSSYTSENAFASTYGQHREKLELKPEWLPILKKECENNNVKFMSTPFDELSLRLLLEIDVDALKIASFDLGNIPFIEKIAKSQKPMVMSTGGGNEEQISSSVEIIKKYNSDLAILHCVSEYPCEFNKLGLENIKSLKRKFPTFAIGSSDHFNGTLSGPIAYMLGARVFEKHVTLNRAWKGTDHSFGLEPDGFRKFSRDIRRVNHMLPAKPTELIGKEQVFQKLGKSLVAAKPIKKGEIFNLDNLSGKIFTQQYIPVRESIHVIGQSATRNINVGEAILYSDLESYD